MSQDTPTKTTGQASHHRVVNLRRSSSAAALRLCLEDAIQDREGTGVGTVGSPRYGKTYFLRRVHAAMLARGVADLVVIHDAKAAEPQFEGMVVKSLADFVSRAGAQGGVWPPTVVFHHANLLERPTVQEAASVAVAACEVGHKPCGCADEVVKATNGRQDWLKPDEGPCFYPLIIREGGAQRISHTWGTQVPQQLPTECKVLTRTVAIFHCEGLAADAASEHFRLGSDGTDVLYRLERGQFVLFCQGRDWDRTIYGPS